MRALPNLSASALNSGVNTPHSSAWIAIANENTSRDQPRSALTGAI
jgi:hypothetical protein